VVANFLFFEFLLTALFFTGLQRCGTSGCANQLSVSFLIAAFVIEVGPLPLALLTVKNVLLKLPVGECVCMASNLRRCHPQERLLA
jgi:hypothetical protein